jgi:hypothetical protein
MSSPKFQKEVLGADKTKTHFRYLEKTNKYRQRYITRDAFFEPSVAAGNKVDKFLAEIRVDFKFKKPAVISSHRVNYIGGLSIKNRDNGLNKVSELLKTIITKCPNVEFITSIELGMLISNK